MEAVKFDLLTCFLYLMFGLLFLFSCRMAVVKQEFAGNQLKSIGQRRYGFSHMAVLLCVLV